jgi:hypothetical protein
MGDAAREVDRDPSGIEITTATGLDPAVTDAYVKQGVDRVLISPPTGDLAALPGALEKFRREVMEPHGAV